MLALEDTICAVASAAGGSARGIVRLSGPHVHELLLQCFDPPVIRKFASVVSGHLHIAQPVGALEADLYFWPNERSYTRQPTAELHTFGSPPLLAAAVRTFCEHGARPAEPGEFTLRAFLAGRLDLTQAEAVLGVIDAAGRKPLDTALAQLAGGLSRPLHTIREELLQLLAHLEAGLDFVEEDIEFVSTDELNLSLANAQQKVEQLVVQLVSRAASTELPRVVLVGLPNVGKSSIFNAIVGRSAAIVSHQPGTTRDYLTSVVEFEGMNCELIDTAGIDIAETLAAIEQSAQHAAAHERERGQLILLCLDSTRPLERIETEWLESSTNAPTPPRICVLTKCDLPKAIDRQVPAIQTSSSSGIGMNRLAEAVKQTLSVAGDEYAVAGTAERCHDSLRATAQSLFRARELNHCRAGDELVAAELRQALTELGKVVGAVYTDDILDRIFSRFCIGK